MFHKSAVISACLCLVLTINGAPATSTKTEVPLPAEIKVCVDLVIKCNNKEQFSHEKIDHICSAISNENGIGYIVTPEDVNYFLGLLNDMIRQNRRHKRQLRYRPIRREVRRMTSSQWRRFTRALRGLKRKGEFDRLAAIHRGFERLRNAHGGPAFLSWHRIYLLVLEHALRRENRLVTLPYWDSSLDYDMDQPELSILWTSRFFGNGHGRVTSGPFVWTTGQGEDLIRNIGSSGTLISKEFFNRVLTRTSHSEITDSSNRQFWLEGYHNGPHVWVDGQMSLLDSAAEDPVFWLHHCFIDYWWQKFMDQQLDRGVNPYNDYPNVQGGHSATALMDPFNITNRAGYSQYWYNNFYRYEDSPSCTRRNTNCNSEFLECNTRLERCVSKQQQGSSGQPSTRPGLRILPLSSARLPLLDFAAVARPLMPTLRMGRRFQSLIIDPRTSGVQLRQAPTVLAKSGSRARSRLSSARESTPRNNPSIAKYMSFLKTANRIAKRSVKYSKFDSQVDQCSAVNEQIRKVA